MSLLKYAFPFTRYLDAANVVTLFNIAVAMLGVHAISQHDLRSTAALICLAAMLDFLDGHIARTYLANRLAARAFGKQLDSFADLLNFSVVPALAIMQVGPSPLANWIAGALVISGVLRLALFGLPENSTTRYRGLPTTYAGFVFALALLIVAEAPHALTPLLVLAGTIALLQVSSVPLPKYNAPLTIAGFAMLFGLTAFGARFL